MYGFPAEQGDGGINDYLHDPFLESLGISVTPLLPAASPNPWEEFYSADTAGNNPDFAHTTHPHIAPSPIASERALSPTSPSTSRPSPSEVLAAPAPVALFLTTQIASPPTSPSTSRPSPFQVPKSTHDDKDDKADMQPSSLTNQTDTHNAGSPTPSNTFPCLQSGCESRSPFKSQKNLQNHTRRSHKPRNAMCPVCGKRFVYQNDVRKHHNINSHTDLPALPPWLPKKSRTRIISSV